MAETWQRFKHRKAAHVHHSDATQAVGEEPGSTGHMQGGASSASRGSTLKRWAAVTLIAIGLIGLGVVVGWFALGRVLTPGTPESEVLRIPVSDVLGSGDGVTQASMPDVRGLSEDDARTVLLDAGIPGSAVSIEKLPSALPKGLVASQSPAFGSAPVDKVVLSISAEAVVPDLAGDAEGEAQASLVALGVRVVVQRVFVAGSDPGLVVSTKPKAGAALPESVTLVVSEPPASVYLGQLRTVDGSPSCSSAEGTLGGRRYDSSLRCRATGEGTEFVWLLGKKVQRFEAVIGVPDGGDQGARVAVTVLADGRKVGGGTATFGKPAVIDVPVAGALQLQVKLRAATSDSSASEATILGDARLIGGKDAIAELAGWAGR